ncbi:hypothetical protein H6P81_004462 [Aristolochia fimbriata]|uniref:Myb-like domain-containing protein n=1 Tax=Aristolochia fimbriata TaxID=158543 RepID=A0AAV7FH16_ARIFI|nr:hypothetical protein H6P81_004462 [Aristolochia fimbriata]
MRDRRSWNVSVDESCEEEKNRVFGEMAEIREAFSGWSWEENKLFELALAVVDEGNPERWNVVAAMVGGKTVEDVQMHYRVLVEDLQYIESGQLDHRLGEAKFHLTADCSCSVCWSEEDQKLLVQLDIK